MTPFFEPAPNPFDEGPDLETLECQCPEFDGQYLMEIDAGSVYLTHKACGRVPRGDWKDLLVMDRIPVTVQTQPYGNCDGSQWHAELRCDCGIVLVATVDGLSVVHDGVPYLVGRDYADRDGQVWRITDERDHADQPLALLLPEGAGAPVPLAQVVAEYGPLTYQCRTLSKEPRP